MKVLCSQEVVSPPRCEVVSCQVTAKASAPQVPWFVLCWWLQQGIREDRVWYKPIDFYALSCSSFRKSTRNLIEIAQRKSQEIVFLQPQQIVPRLNPLEKCVSLFLYLGCGAKYAKLAAVAGRQAVDDQF